MRTGDLKGFLRTSLLERGKGRKSNSGPDSLMRPDNKVMIQQKSYNYRGRTYFLYQKEKAYNDQE